MDVSHWNFEYILFWKAYLTVNQPLINPNPNRVFSEFCLYGIRMFFFILYILYNIHNRPKLRGITCNSVLRNSLNSAEFCGNSATFGVRKFRVILTSGGYFFNAFIFETIQHKIIKIPVFWAVQWLLRTKPHLPFLLFFS